jgi:hypothetical protein
MSLPGGTAEKTERGAHACTPPDDQHDQVSRDVSTFCFLWGVCIVIYVENTLTFGKINLMWYPTPLG